MYLLFLGGGNNYNIMEPKHKNLTKVAIGVGCLAVAYYLLTLFKKRDK